jgi:hypothetical protein
MTVSPEGPWLVVGLFSRALVISTGIDSPELRLLASRVEDVDKPDPDPA